MADPTTTLSNTPSRPPTLDISPACSTPDLDDGLIFCGEIVEKEKDERIVRLSKRETLVPEEMMEALRQMQLEQGMEQQAVFEDLQELQADGDGAADCSSSSSSPSTPEHSILVSPLALKAVTPASGARHIASPQPSRIQPESPLSPPPQANPPSELSIARMIPLPASPAIISSPTPTPPIPTAPSSPLACDEPILRPISSPSMEPAADLTLAKEDLSIENSPNRHLVDHSAPRSPVLGALEHVNGPFQPSTPLLVRNLESPMRALELANGPEIPCGRTANSPGTTGSPSPRVAGELGSAPITEETNESAIHEDTQVSVEMGRSGPAQGSALTASPATSQFLSAGLPETSFDFLVPITGDSSASISIPHPPSVVGSDISMTSLMNAVFPSPAALSRTDSTESLDILRSPARPADASGSSSSDFAVPTLAELLQQSAFTFTLRATEQREIASTNTNQKEGHSALRLSEILRPEAFLPSSHSEVNTLPRDARNTDSPFSLPFPPSAAVNLLDMPLPDISSAPELPAAIVSNAVTLPEQLHTVAPRSEQPGESSVLRPSQASAGLISAAEQPSTPRTTAPATAGSRKPKYMKRNVAVSPDENVALKEKKAKDKEERRTKRKAEGKADVPKDSSKEQEKENATPGTSRSRTTASTKAFELSSKLANAVAATTAVSRSPLKPTSNGVIPAQPPSPAKPSPPKPVAAAKPPPASKLPTSSLPKRSALPVPTGIPRPTASKSFAPSAGRKNPSLLKASMSIMPTAQRASIAVTTTGSPSRSLLSSGAMRVPSPRKQARNRIDDSFARMSSPALIFPSVSRVAPPLPPFGNFDFRSGPFQPPTPSTAIRNLGSPMRVFRQANGQEIPYRKASDSSGTKRAPSPPAAGESSSASASSSSAAEPQSEATEIARPTRQLPARQAKTDSPLNNNVKAAPVKARVAPMKKPPAEPSRMLAMSEVELRQLTAKNTNKNQHYHSHVDVVTVYRDEPRPPSPTSRIRTVADKEKEERKMSRDERAKRRMVQRGESDTEGSEPQAVERPLKHTRGPGDDEDYSTPAAKRRRVEDAEDGSQASDGTEASKASQRSRRSSAGKGKGKRARIVRWDKALLVPPPVISSPSSSRNKEKEPAKGCLMPAVKEIQLDPLGNIPQAGQTPKDIEKQRIKVAKFIYSDDPPEPGMKKNRKAS